VCRAVGKSHVFAFDTERRVESVELTTACPFSNSAILSLVNTVKQFAFATSDQRGGGYAAVTKVWVRYEDFVERASSVQYEETRAEHLPGNQPQRKFAGAGR
jgi:hypothetical protein